MIKIDLYGNLTLRDEQINKRVVSIIRQRFSQEHETKLTRMSIGALMTPPLYTLTPADQADIDAYHKHVLSAIAIGKQAKQDNALLIDTLRHEEAVARLALPAKKATDKDADGKLLYPKVDELDPNTGKPTGKKLVNPAITEDKAERATAQTTVKAVTAPVKALVAKRLKKAQAAAPLV